MDKVSPKRAKPRATRKPKVYCIPVDVATIRNPEVSHAAKTVWLILLTYANKEGVAYPAQDRIAHESGMSRKSAAKCLKELVKARLITVNAKGSNRKGNTRYQVQRRLNLPTSTVHYDLEEVREAPLAMYGLSPSQYQKLKTAVDADKSVPGEFVEVAF